MTGKQAQSVVSKAIRLQSLRKMRVGAAMQIRRLDRVLATSKNWVITAALLFILQATLIITHRPWLDEYQALQLAVQAPDIPTLLDWLHYEGHPPLYYLLVRGLSHVIDPLVTLPVIALAFAALMQWAILFKSPFSRGERILIATSQFVMFEFLTISRSMTIGTTVLVLAMVLWQRRSIWLMIAILPFCDFLYGILSGILMLLKWREKGLYWPGIAIWLVCGLASAWMVRPAPDVIPALMNLGFVPDLAHWTSSISTLLIPMQGGLYPVWNRPPEPFSNVLWMIFLLFAWTQARNNQFHRFLLFSFIALTFAFSMWVYPLAIRHLMLIALLLILLTWRRREDGERSGNGFKLWLMAASICGLLTSAINLVKPFDTADKALAQIEVMGLKDKHWMVFPDSRAQGIAALGNMMFERTELHCMQDFIRWNFRTELLEEGKLEAFLRAEVGNHGRFYLLSDYPLDEVSGDVINLMSFVEAGYIGQSYFLYVVGPDTAERKVDLPRCVPGARPLEKFNKNSWQTLGKIKVSTLFTTIRENLSAIAAHRYF